MLVTPYDTIRPIETLYAGHRFRSRLEARWAVFFQAAGIKYDYEPEGFILSSGERYLPDFLLHLPGQALWVEVKPTGMPADRFWRFLTDIKGDGTILRELPSPDELLNPDFPEGFEIMSWGCWDENYSFCVCPTCRAIGFQFEGRSSRIPCGCTKYNDKNHNWDDPLLVNAITLARSARFERGQL
jgi:hypothetical protein